MKRVKKILILCFGLVLVGVFIAFALWYNNSKEQGEIVVRVAMLPTILNNSLYHEVWHCEDTGHTTLVSYIGTRKTVRDMADSNEFFETVDKIRKRSLNAQEFQHLTTLIGAFLEKDYIYEAEYYLGMNVWHFIISYNDTIYRMDRWAGNTDKFLDIIDEIINLSPINMPERFWP